MKTLQCKPFGVSKDSAKRKAYCRPTLRSKKVTNKHLTLHLKIKPKASRRRETMKIRAEINDRETNKQTKKSRTDQ